MGKNAKIVPFFFKERERTQERCVLLKRVPSPDKNRDCQGWSRCNAEYVWFEFKRKTVASTPAALGSVLIKAEFQILFGTLQGFLSELTYIPGTVFLCVSAPHKYFNHPFYRAGNLLISFLSQSLIFCEKMSKWAICSKKRAIPSFSHFWWATWAIHSHRSYLVNDLSDSLTSLTKKEGMKVLQILFMKKTYIKHTKI